MVVEGNTQFGTVRSSSLDTKLESLLLQKKSAILEKWLDLILEVYPSETQRFLKKQKDRFANPVGYTIFQGMEALYHALIHGIDYDKVSPFLDRIVRIRAVQDFSPSQAIAFIFILKKVIREELGTEIRENQLFDELLILETQIDKLALLSFEIYMKCREKIYEIRVNEVKNSVYMLLKRANLICEIPEQEPDVKDHNIHSLT